MQTNRETKSESPKARLIALYLPQFHPIPENDEWWGKGFTEWTNVAKAKPLFPSHYQPVVPADLGFYDLRVPETRIAQAEMARQYGIEGFCYWHYWFAGKRLLERPFNEVLKSGEPNFPFCLGWANQTWSGIWHGSPDRILMEQTYPGLDDYKSHFVTLLDAFKDSRYITIDEKPVFLVYKPQELPEPKIFTDYWRELAEKSGLKGLYFIGIITDNVSWVPEPNGFDAASIQNPAAKTRKSLKRNYPENIFAKGYNRIVSELSKKVQKEYVPKLPMVYSYEEAIKYAPLGQDVEFEHYPCVFPNWDNTPRSGVNGVVYRNSTPDLFRIHLRQAIEQVAQREAEKRIVFIKSWNEWAEGNYLEPDLRFGRAYLEVIKNEIQ
jgi:hypothetical protein